MVRGNVTSPGLCVPSQGDKLSWVASAKVDIVVARECQCWARTSVAEVRRELVIVAIDATLRTERIDDVDSASM